MAVIKAVSSKAGIGQAIDYVTKEEKTEEKLVIVSGKFVIRLAVGSEEIKKAGKYKVFLLLSFMQPRL